MAKPIALFAPLTPPYGRYTDGGAHHAGRLGALCPAGGAQHALVRTSQLPSPYSLLPPPYSLLPTPYSLPQNTISIQNK